MTTQTQTNSGSSNSTGLHFLDWWRALNNELVAERGQGADANQGDARYFFDRNYSPVTAALLIALDRIGFAA